jgi:hypothetical protein
MSSDTSIYSSGRLSPRAPSSAPSFSVSSCVESVLEKDQKAGPGGGREEDAGDGQVIIQEAKEQYGLIKHMSTIAIAKCARICFIPPTDCAMCGSHWRQDRRGLL